MRLTASLVVVLIASGLVAAAGERPSAKEAFTTRFTAVANGKPAHPECFPAALVEGRRDWSPEKTAAWREAWGRRLASAKVEDVKETGDSAVARFTGGDLSRYEVPLLWDGTSWTLAAAEPYAIGGDALDRANGKKPAHASLVRRTAATKGYGQSAFSFSHVTSDMEIAKGRADVWYCHNGDLHASGDGQIQDLGAIDWAKTTGLPTGPWSKGTVPATEGHVYAVRCRREGRYDFYVLLRVSRLKGENLDFDWRLAALGEGAPASIAKTQRPTDNDGADGADGLCGKNG